MNVLLVGFNKSWAEALEQEDVKVFVIEERDIWVKKIYLRKIILILKMLLFSNINKKQILNN